ncbi:hypothetical protein AB1Y20_020303 [Prymnesium parvum]|uniref:ABC transporter domain-containing protein n=1 Tax=Prymnesium parvum TaxID=97485 RepID=A0AB34JWX3_PRYPA
MVLRVRITRLSDACPFLNDELAFDLLPGQVVWLRGASGAGKSYTSLHLAGLATLPGAHVEQQWDPSVAEAQRIGFLFQKGVLIDSLSLAANLSLAAAAAGLPSDSSAIASALEAVGLSPTADGPKMPGELSGGMLRRAALAQILAQRKRVVILDEPFVGLDPPVAHEIVLLLQRVVVEHGIALLLISHMAERAAALSPAATLSLERARPEDGSARRHDPDLSGLRFSMRTFRRFVDYLLISAPLIVMAFAATGAALSMLLADLLARVDVVRIIAGFLKTYLKGNPALPMILQLVDGVVKQNEAAAKRKLFALALGSVFTIELGPLLTALLLAGRIGGSYAGGVAMMASTNQIDLLTVLGVGATAWTFFPAIIAAAVAAPLLSMLGTTVALFVGQVVGGPAGFDMISHEEYWQEVSSTIFQQPPGAHILKYAPLVNCYRSLGFMLSTMLISQLCSRSQKRLQPRHVPLVITSAVVLSCLAVLVLDWGFSQLFVRLDGGDILAPENDFALEESSADDEDNESQDDESFFSGTNTEAQSFSTDHDDEL